MWIPPPSNDLELLILIAFMIATPAFIWFLYRDIKRSKRARHG